MMKRFTWIVAPVGALLMASCAQAADWFVDINSPQNPGIAGSSWATAWTELHVALDPLSPVHAGDTIHIAQGVYRPIILDQDDPTGATFRITIADHGLKIKGGYLGNAAQNPNPGLRDINAYPTILSGLVNGVVYARHVITVWDLGLNNLSASRVDIDGVTIQEGRAFGAEDLPPNVEPANEKRGGGINILESKVALIRCTIIDCDALEEGGGVSMYDRAVHPGGSQSAPYVARLDMVNCLVTDCQGRRGGGVANAETTSYLVNTIIRECRAIEEGVGTTGTGGAVELGTPAAQRIHHVH